jgi:ribonuclease P protein component
VIGRNNRFHGRSSLARHYAKSKSVRTSTMALRFLVNNRRREYRMAVVVSRKVSKSAVVRNRIRRRLYERVRILSTGFTEPYDLVLLAYDEKLATMPAPDLAAEVQKLLQKAATTPAQSAQHAIVESKE